jgi:hypothetical protein
MVSRFRQEDEKEERPMKAYLVSSQLVYALCLAPWFLIWGITLMGFANGINWFSLTLTGVVSLYPIAAIVCSILAWKFRDKRRRAAVIVNLIPMLWILLVVVPFAVINL